MRKSQLNGQQVSLNSYLQKPAPVTTQQPPSKYPSQHSNHSNKPSNNNNLNPFSLFANNSPQEYKNASVDSSMRNVYLKRTTSEEDKNPAVAKKQRILPKTVTLTKPPINNYNNANYNINYNRPSSGESRRYSASPSLDDDFEKKKDKALNDIDGSKLELLRKSYNLSHSQKNALEAIMQRKSVFYTGAAGTGKSYILQVLLDVVEILGLSSKVAITAPTGVAACNIRGLTIHSWSGIGLGAEKLENLLPIVMKNRTANQRWKETEILIIDEISMLSAELFDKLDIIGRRLRNNLAPFGGLQLILCGDFFQLPPIGIGKSTNFCFESEAWKELFGTQELASQPMVSQYQARSMSSSSPSSSSGSGEVILLDKVFRQKDDITFLNVLNSLRKGQVTPQVMEILTKKVHASHLLKRQEEEEDLYRSQNPVASSNKLEDAGSISKAKIRPTKLFSTNNDVDTFNLKELQHLQEEDDPRQFNAIDDGRDPYLGQLRAGTKAPQVLVLKIGAQVMLLKNLDTESGLVNGTRGTVIGFERSNGRSQYFPMLPVVKFQTIIGSEKSEETVTLIHDTWDIKVGDSILASRIQIPLMLAWAISIHKSQGMTIPFLEVSFNRIFEYGQAYVALSRATSLEGLILTGFSANAVRAHPKVIAFYNFLKQSKESTRKGAPQDEAIFEVQLKDLVNQFQGMKKDQVNNDDWLESRNKPSAASSRPASKAGDDDYDFTSIEPDEWLEKKRGPRSSLPPSGFNQHNLGEGRMSNPEGVAKRDNVIVTEYKPQKAHLAVPTTIDLSQDNVTDLTQSTYASTRSSATPLKTAYGEVHKSNDSSIQSLNVNEDLKRKIEENRQNALKKLAQLRKRQEEEMNNVLASYSL